MTPEEQAERERLAAALSAASAFVEAMERFITVERGPLQPVFTSLRPQTIAKKIQEAKRARQARSAA